MTRSRGRPATAEQLLRISLPGVELGQVHCHRITWRCRAWRARDRFSGGVHKQNDRTARRSDADWRVAAARARPGWACTRGCTDHAATLCGSGQERIADTEHRGGEGADRFWSRSTINLPIEEQTARGAPICLDRENREKLIYSRPLYLSLLLLNREPIGLM